MTAAIFVHSQTTVSPQVSLLESVVAGGGALAGAVPATNRQNVSARALQAADFLCAAFLLRSQTWAGTRRDVAFRHVCAGERERRDLERLNDAPHRFAKVSIPFALHDTRSLRT
jgi:hypothetical protein